MTGEEVPAPEAIFHSTSLWGPNSAGRPRESEIPTPLTPRNRGQSSFAAAALPTAVSTTNAKTHLIFEDAITRRLRAENAWRMQGGSTVPNPECSHIACQAAAGGATKAGTPRILG